jgi:RNA polymerase sigma factor (sigma-70 family)
VTLVEDSELAIRVADGDRAALATVYDRYADRLFDFCNSMLRDREEAADAVQQCLLIAAEKMGSLRDPSKMKSWLYAVARHDCLRRIRQRSREVVDQEAVETEPSGILSDDRTDVEALQELVWSAAKGLAPKDRALLDLHVRQGLNGQDLADAVGVKASNVYVMVNRLKAQFERAMGALLVIRLARTDCPELEAILEGSGTEFTVLLRKRVARHIEGCDICEDNRQRLASPLALLAAVPLVPAPLFLRERVLRNGPPPGEGSAHGGTSTQDGPATGPSAQIPKLSDRTGFPKDASGVGLITVWAAAVAVVVVAAVVAGMALSAPSSAVSAKQGTAHRTHQAPFTSTPTLPTTSTQVGGAHTPTTTLPNGGKGTVATTAPPHGSTQTSVPPQGFTSTTTTSTSANQQGSTNTTSPTCPLGASRSVGMTVTSDGVGYWVAQSNGDVIAYGDAAQYAPSSVSSAPIAPISAVSGSTGYLTLASDGTVAGAGANSEGSASSVGASCDVVAISATPDGHGYWITLSSGAVLTFGDALSYGSALGATGGFPIAGMAPTPDGKGYWLVASNGGIFTFGDAPNKGGVGSHLGAPIVGMAPSPDGGGYYMVASDGGIFSFGDAHFYGSAAPSSSPVVAVSADPSGTGYWVLEANGQVMPYGSATTYPPA